ncbi:DASH complex subunit Dad3-domain-containing protein [Mycena albidolilacea]|uniref:DASH complex subunit DAD3 n=1 Tax=Mycena albidolilacea TaxID=1033008 RepID=A0AAD7EY35_9AGAR|nr:DASH complex subunit Dad3-domain-containing protein [Mycena albidolilacea]
MSSPPPPDIFAENPYLNHPSLSPIEVEVLWEYAKLAQNLKQLKQKTRNLTEQPDATLTARLRAVENKMGLILTLFKASVWGVINEQNAASPESFDATLR